MKSFLTGYELKLEGDFSHNFVGGKGFTFWAAAVPSREPFFIYNIPLSKPLKKGGKKTSSIYSQAWDSRKKHGFPRMAGLVFWFQPRQLQPANSAGWPFWGRLKRVTSNGLGDKLRYVFETTWTFSAFFEPKSALFFGWVGFCLPIFPIQKLWSKAQVTQSTVVSRRQHHHCCGDSYVLPKSLHEKKTEKFFSIEKMRGKNTPEAILRKNSWPFLGFVNEHVTPQVTKPNLGIEVGQSNWITNRCMFLKKHSHPGSPIRDTPNS